MILKVLPFESEVKQECCYYHPYQHCTGDPSQRTNTRVVSKGLQGVPFILTFKTILDIKMFLKSIANIICLNSSVS